MPGSMASVGQEAESAPASAAAAGKVQPAELWDRLQALRDFYTSVSNEGGALHVGKFVAHGVLEQCRAVSVDVHALQMRCFFPLQRM